MSTQHYWDEIWEGGRIEKERNVICFRYLQNRSDNNKLAGLNKVKFYIYPPRNHNQEVWDFYLKFLDGLLNKDFYSLESPSGLKIGLKNIALTVTINAAAMDGNKNLIFTYLNLFRYMLEHNKCLVIFYNKNKDLNLGQAELLASFIEINRIDDYKLSGVENQNHAICGDYWNICPNPARKYEETKADLWNPELNHRAGRFYFLEEN